MKKKIIAIVIGILCVIVAAIGLFQFAFKTKATYVKDVDSDKFNKAYDLLAMHILRMAKKLTYIIQTL